jgi:hypothetical protein
MLTLELLRGRLCCGGVRPAKDGDRARRHHPTIPHISGTAVRWCRLAQVAVPDRGTGPAPAPHVPFDDQAATH